MTPLQWKRLFIRIVGWIALLILGLLIATVGAAAWRMYGKAEEARIAHADAMIALENLHERKATVEESLSKLGTERGIEEEIRLRFQLAKPGEEQIVLVAAQANASTSASPQNKSLWEIILDWFGR
ncbi:hypothetical protein K2X83_02425 [Patescibacteria group bacterium]|nr:hypothetical protein [Patescibacteria group bacterium]